MSRKELLARVVSEQIIGVVREETVAAATAVADAFARNGVRILEITFTTPDAVDLMAALAKRYAQEVTIAAGTVRSPNDAAIVHRRLGNVDQAIANYERALPLARATHDRTLEAIVLNNLAWLYQLKQDGRALALAERAHELAPQNLEITDTLAWLVEKSGDNARALALLAPFAGDPAASPAMLYHLAVALARSGNGPDARRILEPLLAAGTQFEGREEAVLLIKDIPAR